MLLFSLIILSFLVFRLVGVYWQLMNGLEYWDVMVCTHLVIVVQ